MRSLQVSAMTRPSGSRLSVISASGLRACTSCAGGIVAEGGDRGPGLAPDQAAELVVGKADRLARRIDPPGQLPGRIIGVPRDGAVEVGLRHHLSGRVILIPPGQAGPGDIGQAQRAVVAEFGAGAVGTGHGGELIKRPVFVPGPLAGRAEIADQVAFGVVVPLVAGAVREARGPPAARRPSR